MKKRNSDIWLKLPVWALGMGPLAWGVWAFFADALGVDPVETMLLVPGRWALVFLLLGLAVSPVRRFTGWNRIIRIRRLLGLFAFFYASLHFLIYLAVDQGFAWSFILEDIAERPFITVGFAALVLLVPLAVTSTRGWIRSLGRRWQLLHRLVYPATALGALHFYWKVKADTFWPLVAAGILGVLLLARVPGWMARGARRRGSGGRKETRRTARIPSRGTFAEGR